MAAPLPFSTVSPKLVNYSFLNTLEASGTLDFYAGSGINTTESYILRTTTFPSNTIEINTSSPTLTQDFVLKKEVNYDLEFKTGQVVNGVGLVTLGWGISGNASAVIYGQMIVDLIRVRDAAETIIGTATSGILEKNGVGYTTTQSTLFLSLTRTILKRGDSLRLSVKAYLKNNTGTFGASIVFGQDPENRDGTIIIPSTDDTRTKLIASVVFEDNS